MKAKHTPSTAPADAPAAIRLAPLAKRWGCTRQTLHNMINDGQLRSFKVRNCRLVPFSEVERIEKGEAA